LFCSPYGKKVSCDELFEAVKEVMLKAGGKPHWGKSHDLTFDQLTTMYKSLGRFVDIRNKLDPHRMFTNNFLKRVLGD